MTLEEMYEADDRLLEEMGRLLRERRELLDLIDAAEAERDRETMRLRLVIQAARDELESNDEAGAYLILKNSGV